MKVLVYLIDDESTFRSQFKRAMKTAGFRTDEFEIHELDSTDEAIEEFQRESTRPRLALFDQNVKSSRYLGTEAIGQIRANGDSDSVLGVISSSNRENEVAEARANGAQFWIRKGGGRAAMIAKMKRFKAEVFDLIVAEEPVPSWLEIGLE